VIEQYRSLDRSRDSTMKIRAVIEEGDGSARQIQMILYRKREQDGSQRMLAEFISPAEERDRSALVTVYPDGRVEGARYLQSSHSFIVTRSPTDEESLFGMTLQELAGGQTEKYEFKRAGEGQIDSTPVYILEGKLKRGAESRFELLRLFISKENWAALLIEAYDDKGRLLRRITTKEMKSIGGYPTRTRWEVDNPERQKKIIFEVLDAKYDQGLSDSIFTRERLKRAASR
jgi:outer membrane lipoprotein-sorting protein